MKAVELNQIIFAYPNEEHLFNEINVAFEQDEFVFILGANGSGKSTLLKLIIGDCLAEKGDILFSGTRNMRFVQRAKFLGYVPQALGIDPEMSVVDTFYFIASVQKISTITAKEFISEWVDYFSFENLLEKRLKHLSGGQKQLVNIALGIMHKPNVLLLDEPFVGLDYGIVSKIIPFLKERVKTILCVSHRIDLAEQNADKVLILKNGKCKEFATPEEVIRNNAYAIFQIDIKGSTLLELKFRKEILVKRFGNRIEIICENEDALVEEIEAFIQKNNHLVHSVHHFKNNLKSSLIGRYDMSFVEKQKKNKNKKRK